MNKIRKCNIQLIIIVITIITLSLSATYAYMNFVISNNTTAQGNAGCFDVNYSGQEITANDIVSTSNYTQGAKYQVTLSKDANCNIYTKVDLFVHTNTTTTAPIESIKALKYKVMLSNTEISTGVIDATGDIKIATVNLTTTPTTYDIYIWVDNAISIGFYDQKTYSGYIYATSAQTSTIVPVETVASELVINKYNDGSTITAVNIGGNTSKPKVHLNASQGIMLDNNGNYRYYGADPNNYVWYNNELWRIISVGNVKSSKTDTVGETRVKIVKADILIDDNGLDEYSYDASELGVNSAFGVNDWSKSDLMTELNTLYLNSTNGTCHSGNSNTNTAVACNFTNNGLIEEARNLTSDALYYLGASSSSQGLYANDYYNFERGTTVYNCSSSDCGGKRATTWVGRVGIMYPSDYAYASDLSLCTLDGYSYDTNTDCKSNWLLVTDNSQWLISPISSGAWNVFLLSKKGRIVEEGGMGIWITYYVRPVQYLKSSVKIINGEGTEQNPYIISIPE